MGFFNDIINAAEVVGGIALIATGTPLGILGGSLLEASFASQQGWLGGGAKNFFSSGVGQGLTMAVGLASGAMAIESAMSATAPIATAGGSMTATADEAAQGAAYQAANSAATTSGAFAAQNVTAANSQIMAAMSTTASADPSLLAAPSGDILAASANPAVGSQLLQSVTGEVPLDPSTPVQAAAQAGAATTAAVSPQGGSTNINTSANPNTAATTPPGMMSQVGSFLGTAADKVGAALSTPAGMIMGGQALSGFAQGKAQENIMQRQLAAAQWGNTQWENPAQVAQLQSAAAAPINVPSGYLARAANARAIMNGAVSQTTPLSGAPPPAIPAPSLPTPGTQPPGSAGGGPVPLYMANQPTRGGVIGG